MDDQDGWMSLVLSCSPAFQGVPGHIPKSPRVRRVKTGDKAQLVEFLLSMQEPLNSVVISPESGACL